MSWIWDSICYDIAVGEDLSSNIKIFVKKTLMLKVSGIYEGDFHTLEFAPFLL